MRLRPERVDEVVHGLELAHHADQLGAVAEGHDGADRLLMYHHGHCVHDEGLIAYGHFDVTMHRFEVARE